MTKPESRKIVVDADVARAAGGVEATFPASKQCRDFLQSMLEVCLRFVMSPELRQEWKKHQSAFARRWQVQMWGRKKVQFVRDSGVVIDRVRRQLTEAIREAPLSDTQQDQMEKDLHLIVAANTASQFRERPSSESREVSHG